MIDFIFLIGCRNCLESDGEDHLFNLIEGVLRNIRERQNLRLQDYWNSGCTKRGEITENRHAYCYQFVQ